MKCSPEKNLEIEVLPKNALDLFQFENLLLDRQFQEAETLLIFL